MLIIISPAKTMDPNPVNLNIPVSQPEFLTDTEEIVSVLKKYTPKKLGTLMKINPKLSQLNFERYQEWELPFKEHNAKPAIFAFKGDVYNGININEYSDSDLEYSQAALRILSGLYGVLRPLDLIQPYRLEMGTKLKLKRKKDLYEFWGTKLRTTLQENLSSIKPSVLINLASAEYSKAVQLNQLTSRIITPVFKEFHNGTYKFMSVFGKKARGLMVSYIVKNRIHNPEEIKLFDTDGYYYNDQLSKGDEWVFTRG
jgi:cytoplasmic iron level regulating protein YaaA (DUF328/UPF0246 family)